MVKKENCKDCFDSKTGPLCDRHITEQSMKFVKDGIHISYWLDDMAAWLATRDNKNFEYLCKLLTGARFEKMILEDQPPKKEEPLLTKEQYELLCGIFHGEIKVPLPEMDKEEPRLKRSKNWELLSAIIEMREPAWKDHKCNPEEHVKCLAEAEKTRDASGYGTIFMGDFPEAPPLLNITQLKELMDNLELNGFSHDEAMAIVLKVVGRG